jgi:hypothetical protein
MNDIDVNGALLDALKKRWRTPDGKPNVGGYTPLQFDTSKVKLQMVRIDYIDLQKYLVKKPEILREETITNTSKATVTHTFNYSKATTDSYTWHITSGVKLTAGATAKVGLPLVGEGEASTSVELSFEAGYEKTQDVTVSWNDQVEVEVPPKASVQTQAILSTGTVSNVPFKAYMHAFGQVGCLIQADSIHQRWEWAELDTGIGWQDPGYAKLKQLPLDPAEREFIVDGVFNGSVGFDVIISANPVDPKIVPHST